LIQLNYRDAKPIYEQIKDGLMHLLVTKSIQPDEKLPSVRELASGLAINPNTIQRAYRELESEGYIYTVPGKGSFAASSKEIIDARSQELFEAFDHTVKELFLCGYGKKELETRMEKLEKGVKES
jgi:GntR family transcriptional regulator